MWIWECRKVSCLYMINDIDYSNASYMRYPWLGHGMVECISIPESMQGSVEWTCIKKILWILLLCIECMPMKGVNDWLHKCRCNVVMYGMNALRWMHVVCGLTNDWNGELMIILELFRRLLWMQDSHDQLATRNALWKSKVVWMIRLWTYVSGILFRAWQWEVRPWPMPESTMWKSLLNLNCEFQI